MSTFTTATSATGTTPADPTKHVNYHLGMVLGVDDFNQEFAYLSGHDQWLARDLIGYGVVSGLRVRKELDDGKPRIRVEAGAALSPRGQLIRVPAAQCAYFNDWFALDQTKKDLAERGLALNASQTIYVVLCYRDCETDKVPIAGEPCRSEDSLMVSSRLADDFELRLTFDPPGQREEDATRDFVKWFNEIEVIETGASVDLDLFLNELRVAAHTTSSPPAAGSGPLPDYLYGSPPESLRINTADLCKYLRAAFHLWVTELRPLWRPDWFGPARRCSGQTGQPEVKPEECLLLAELNVPVEPAGGGVIRVSDPNGIRVLEDQSPFLLPLRMLQEWLLCGKISRPELDDPREFATLYLQDWSHIRVWFHHPALLNAPLGAVTVEVESLQIGSPPQTEPQLIDFRAVDDEVNVYEMEFDPPLQNGNRVTVRFNADSITERNTGRPFSDILNLAVYAYLNREGNLLSAYLAVAFNNVLDDLADVTAPAPAEGDVLTFSAGEWRSGRLRHSDLDGLSADDHLDYYHLDGLRPLRADLDAGNHRIKELSAAIADGDAVPFEQAIKTGQAALGDMAGSNFPELLISKLQNNPVNAAVPNQGDVLTWTGTEWQPQQPTTQSSRPRMILPFAQIIRVEAGKYEVWFNLDAPTNRAEIRELRPEGVEVMAENLVFPDFLTPIASRIITPPPPPLPIPFGFNQFTIILEKEFEFLRFTFFLKKIGLHIPVTATQSQNMTLDTYVDNFGITFPGYNPESRTVTIFVRNLGLKE